MKLFDYSTVPGVVCGQENNNDLFIRKTIFEKGYFENDFHNHPNSYEFYIILDGKITFANNNIEINATTNSIVYFEEAELHKITRVDETVTMLLIKKIGATKSN